MNQLLTCLSRKAESCCCAARIAGWRSLLRDLQDNFELGPRLPLCMVFVSIIQPHAVFAARYDSKPSAFLHVTISHALPAFSSGHIGLDHHNGSMGQENGPLVAFDIRIHVQSQDPEKTFCRFSSEWPTDDRLNEVRRGMICVAGSRRGRKGRDKAIKIRENGGCNVTPDKRHQPGCVDRKTTSTQESLSSRR